jgi:hypothetical protein
MHSSRARSRPAAGAERRIGVGQRRRFAVVLALFGALSAEAVAGGAAAGTDARAAPVLVGRWSVEDRARVTAVLRRLPAVIVANAPRRIVRDRARCEPDGLPRDEDLFDAGGDAHLCAAPVAAAGLDAGRQVALVSLLGFDRAVGWSDDPAWRRLNGWQLSIAHPLHPRPDNVHEAGFVAPRGGRSPRWDLASFTAALLLDADGDGSVGCRLLSQAAFVRARLAGLQPGAAAIAPARCQAFERWADLDRLAGVEIVLATPSTAMAASLFGHVFLRLVYRDDEGGTPLHVSWSVAFLADNEVPFAAERNYALKGIAGYYTASLHERAFLEAYREYVVLEGRDLRRWRLNLSADERRALMQRLWTVKGAGRYAYYFFRRNCATLALDIVDQARASGAPLEQPGLFAAPPASLLEPWARARGADGAPLLQFEPEPLWSFDHQARIGSHHRRALEARIVTSLGDLAGAALRATFEAAHLPSPDARAAAYERLAAQLAEPPVGAESDVRAWLSDSAVIESHLATLANLEAEARADRERHRRLAQAVAELTAHLRADAAALRAGAGVADAERLEAAVHLAAGDGADDRLRGYSALLDVTRRLSRRPGTAPIIDRARLLGLLQSEARYDVTRMKNVAGLRDGLLFVEPALSIDEQPYVGGHADLIHFPVETQVASPLRALQRTRRALFVARGFDTSGPTDAQRAAEAAAVIQSERGEYEAALSRSGIDQLGVLAGVAADGAPGAAVVPIAALTGALYDERIGDHRRFGFPSDTAMVVGRSEVVVAGADGAPVVRAYDARLFGYRSLRPALSEAGAGKGPFGWEIFLDLAGNRARNLAAAGKVGWGLLVPVLERRDLGDHLLATLGVAYEVYFPGDAPGPIGRQHGLAVPIGLEARFGVGTMPRHRSWIGARLWAQPLAIGGGLPDRLLTDAGATVEAHLALRDRADGGGHDPALVLRAQASRSSLSFDRIPERTQAMISVGVALR